MHKQYSPLHGWRKRLLAGLPQVFSRGRQVIKTELKKHNQLIEQLYGEIGHLTIELNWLQKSDRNVAPGRAANEDRMGKSSLFDKLSAELLGLN